MAGLERRGAMHDGRALYDEGDVLASSARSRPLPAVWIPILSDLLFRWRLCDIVTRDSVSGACMLWCYRLGRVFTRLEIPCAGRQPVRRKLVLLPSRDIILMTSPRLASVVYRTRWLSPWKPRLANADSRRTLMVWSTLKGVSLLLKHSIE